MQRVRLDSTERRRRKAREARFKAEQRELANKPPPKRDGAMGRGVWNGGQVTHNKDKALLAYLQRIQREGRELTGPQKVALGRIMKERFPSQMDKKAEEDKNDVSFSWASGARDDRKTNAVTAVKVAARPARLGLGAKHVVHTKELSGTMMAGGLALQKKMKKAEKKRKLRDEEELSDNQDNQDKSGDDEDDSRAVLLSTIKGEKDKQALELHRARMDKEERQQEKRKRRKLKEKAKRAKKRQKKAMDNFTATEIGDEKNCEEVNGASRQNSAEGGGKVLNSDDNKIDNLAVLEQKHEKKKKEEKTRKKKAKKKKKKKTKKKKKAKKKKKKKKKRTCESSGSGSNSSSSSSSSSSSDSSSGDSDSDSDSDSDRGSGDDISSASKSQFPVSAIPSVPGSKTTENNMDYGSVVKRDAVQKSSAQMSVSESVKVSNSTYRKVETKKERRDRINNACKVRRKRKKTRSRQKNLKKDNRPKDKKPTFLTPGAVDYDPNAPRLRGEKRPHEGGVRVDREGSKLGPGKQSTVNLITKKPRLSHVPEPSFDPKEWESVEPRRGSKEEEWASNWS